MFDYVLSSTFLRGILLAKNSLSELLKEHTQRESKQGVVPNRESAKGLGDTTFESTKGNADCLQR